MDIQQLPSDGSPYSQEHPTSLMGTISENENNVELTDTPVDAVADPDIFFGSEAPRSPQKKEEKIIEKVSLAWEIVQAEFALWTVAYAFLLTKVWSYHRPAYKVFNYLIVTPFILWIVAILSFMLPSIVISIRLSWSLQRRLFRLFQAGQPLPPPSSEMITVATSHDNLASPGVLRRTDFSCSYRPEPTSPPLHRERLSSVSSHEHRPPPQRRRLSFHV